MNKKTNLIWIDLEMTGLSPENDVIIEIATVVTDADLNVIDEGPSLAIHQDNNYLVQGKSWLQTHINKSGEKTQRIGLYYRMEEDGSISRATSHSPAA